MTTPADDACTWIPAKPGWGKLKEAQIIGSLPVEEQDEYERLCAKRRLTAEDRERGGRLLRRAAMLHRGLKTEDGPPRG